MKRWDFGPKSRTFLMKIAKFTTLRSTVVHKIAEKEWDKMKRRVEEQTKIWDCSSKKWDSILENDMVVLLAIP